MRKFDSAPLERLSALGLMAVIVWVNAYICREMFFSSAAHMNSMQGFWIAMAQKAGASWFWPNWWRYWDCGMPFEFVYAPLVPGLTALVSWLRRIPADVAFQSVSGLVYCLTPAAMFVLVWRMTRSQGCGFVAAMLYSLTAPTEIILPDDRFGWSRFWDARRLYVMGVWDETPHMAALALLPFVILALWMAMEKRKPAYYAGAAAAIVLAALASAFGPVLVLLSSVCLLFTAGRDRPGQNAALVLCIGAYAYTVVCPFLSPSNIAAIRSSSAQGGHGWTISSLTALAIFSLGWAVLWAWLRVRTTDRWVQFVSLFAYATTAIPLIETYLNRHFLPQPNRYRVESEFALALLLTVLGRAAYRRMPGSVRVAFMMVLTALAAEQVISHRKFAKAELPTEDVRGRIEYRVSKWAEGNLPEMRMMLPGSIGKWADVFTNIQQFSGGSWSTAYNATQQLAVEGVYNGSTAPEEDARVALLWLKAYGTGAVAVPGPNSKETWKGFQHPGKFDGLLPRVWREEDVSLYLTGALPVIHAVAEDAVVQHAPKGPADTAEIAKYLASMEEGSRTRAQVRWTGPNHLVATLTTKPSDAVTVRLTHHSGWNATVNGARREIYTDGLGLMWLRPNCAGLCKIQLNYEGGLELRACRVLSYAALFGGPLALVLLRHTRWRRTLMQR